jgi:hypothetical protein
MWSGHKAAVYARHHARLQSHGECAHYVSNAIRHGSISFPNTHYARDMGSTLRLNGFHQVYGNPIEGDVAVIQPIPGHPYGHACIYDGHQWISDFVQRTMYPGPGYRKIAPSYELYRHN